MSTFSKAMREARISKGWSQMDLARLLEVSQPMVSYWERDRGAPDATMTAKIQSLVGAPGTGASVGESIGDVDEEEEDDGLDGFEPIGQSGFSDFPIDSPMIRTEHRTVHDILRRIEKDQMVLTPDFQRDFVWDERQQSRLIESMLMRIPLPVMYLAENLDGKLVVVDGLQRITTFWSFIKGDLALKLEQPELKGKRFGDLDMRFQTRIEDTTLTLYIIDAKVKEQVRLDIFERVNSGAPLTRPQMRNCIYNGPGTKWLRDRASSPAFAQLFTPNQRDKLAKAMRDREFANRFAAFQLKGWQSYRGDMDDFLRGAILELNGLTEEMRSRLTEDFERGVRNNVFLFGKMAFRRHQAGQEKRSPLNVALFDVMSTALSHHDEERVASVKDAMREAFYALLQQEEFRMAIAYGTSHTDHVEKRFAAVNNALVPLLGDPQGAR